MFSKWSSTGHLGCSLLFIFSWFEKHCGTMEAFVCSPLGRENTVSLLDLALRSKESETNNIALVLG